jgi:hypothetical protein
MPHDAGAEDRDSFDLLSFHRKTGPLAG